MSMRLDEAMADFMSCLIVSALHSVGSNHMTWQQEIRDAILDRILMLAIATHQLPTRNTRLHQQHVKILERLGRLAICIIQVLCTGRFLWQVGQTELDIQSNNGTCTKALKFTSDRTSFIKPFIASQSSLGSMFLMNRAFISISACSSSASFG